MEKRGGYRENAGRPKGLPNKKNQELVARVESEGIMPIDVFLNDMRYYYALGENKMRVAEQLPAGEEQTTEYKVATSLKTIARDCARDAAPYVHARLANVQGNIKITNAEAELAELE